MFTCVTLTHTKNICVSALDFYNLAMLSTVYVIVLYNNYSRNVHLSAPITDRLTLLVFLTKDAVTLRSIKRLVLPKAGTL